MCNACSGRTTLFPSFVLGTYTTCGCGGNTGCGCGGNAGNTGCGCTGRCDPDYGVMPLGCGRNRGCTRCGC